MKGLRNRDITSSISNYNHPTYCSHPTLTMWHRSQKCSQSLARISLQVCGGSFCGQQVFGNKNTGRWQCGRVGFHIFVPWLLACYTVSLSLFILFISSKTQEEMEVAYSGNLVLLSCPSLFFPLLLDIKMIGYWLSMLFLGTQRCALKHEQQLNNTL